MPIHPEQRALYPQDWKQISSRIRFGRAKGRCEMKIDGKRCSARHGKEHPITGSKVILTTMHLDHDPTNNADSNLLAACQRCHNRYDRAHRNETRRASKHRGQGVLFA